MTPWTVACQAPLSTGFARQEYWSGVTMGCYLAIKKDEIMLLAATRMNLEIIILSEVSQKEKDKYHMILLICGI